VASLSPSPFPFPFASPDTEDAEALALAARYLIQASTTTATWLLGGRVAPEEASLLESLRDSLHAGATLCDGLLDLTDHVSRR